MNVRTAQQEELDQLARVWFDAWNDGHGAIVPVALARSRTVENFRERLPDLLPDLRVVGEIRTPLGLAVIKDAELYQLFVAAHARGKGVARVLLEDAEDRLAGNGIRTAWLDCAAGNDRAARFYEKSGWRRSGNVTRDIQLENESVKLDVWRYEKELGSI